jgi:peptidoglycan/xylan/chitin deacetylase (PgdA/CDA1 family)
MKPTEQLLIYPHRGPGMDHDRYPRNNLFKRPPIRWPKGAKVALFVLPIIEFFPLDMPLGLVPGGMTRPYPDYWNYTLRDYGNRVGVYRIINTLDHYRIKATAAFNSRAAARYPFLLAQFVKRNWEIMAMGVDMAKVHQSGVDRQTEAQWAAEAVTTLRQMSRQPVKGWLSPAMRESFNTPDLVADQGIEYICDWPNDDLPYTFKIQGKGEHTTIVSMPVGYELSDLKLIWEYQQTPEQWAGQIIDYFEFIYREAEEYGGRLMALPLRPWLIGMPHRIGALEKVLENIMSRTEVWSATGAEIIDHWRKYAEDNK